MKIKIIDLLNKIYDKDNIPQKIIYNNCLWEYCDICSDFEDKNKNYLLVDFINRYDDINEFLNSEVEIIEENDSFTGVKFFSNGNCFFGVDTSGELKPKDGVVVDSKIEKIDINRMLQTKKWKRDKNAWKKINELIDEVNKLKNGGK